MSIIEQIRAGKIDCNNQELFFSIVIKGLIESLNNKILIRNDYVKHFILHTGDDIMYISNKGQDQSIEPLEISNESYIYNVVPRCIVNPGSISVIPDQTSNPYTRGEFQFENEQKLYTLSAEYRRMPIKINFDLKYRLASFTDSLRLIQQVISKLSFIQTYTIVYMGISIKCSYKIPDDFQSEYLTELDGTSKEKYKNISVSLEVESNFPIFENKTVVDANTRIINPKHNIII